MENENKIDSDHTSTGDEVEEIVAPVSDSDDWTTSNMPHRLSSDGKFWFHILMTNSKPRTSLETT